MVPRLIPVPPVRLVFRSSVYLSIGIAAFTLQHLTGIQVLWWVGLFLVYMAVQRLITNVFDQIADRIYGWVTRHTPAFIAWHAHVSELCSERQIDMPPDAVSLFGKGLSPEEVCRIAIKRSMPLGPVKQKRCIDLVALPSAT